MTFSSRLAERQKFCAISNIFRRQGVSQKGAFKIDFTTPQEQAIGHSGSALLIAAAAGSGKTRVLVERLMRRISEPDGADIDRFLVITFTRAAAAELKERVLSEIAGRLSENPFSPRLRRQMTLVYKARITTIHSFCAEILREYAHLLDLRPDFRMIDDAESKIIRLQALDELLEARYENMTEGFKLLVDTMSAGRDDKTLCEIVLETYSKLQSHPYPQKWLEERRDEQITDADVSNTVYGALLLRRAKSTVDYWISRFQDVLNEIGTDSKVSAAYAASFCATLDSMRLFSEALAVSWDDAYMNADIEFPKLKALRSYEGTLDTENIKEIRKRAKKDMDKLANSIDAPSSDLISDIRAVKPATDELFSLVLDFGALYAEKKRLRGVCDYNDLEHLSLKLLVESETGLPTPLSRNIANRFEEVLVDEYQDVNRVQDLLFTAVSKDCKNLVMVGDVKQSIYRFRLADPAIFLEKYSSFSDEAIEGVPRRILLSQNFRSRKEILDYVNIVFAGIMSKTLGEMEYGEDEMLRDGAKFEEPVTPPCEIVLLDVKDDDSGERRIQLEAKYTAEYIKRLLNSGMTVKDGDTVRPLKPGDIVILLRSRKDREELYTAALNDMGINASSQNAVSIFEKPEIQILISLLRIIDNPLQDVALIAVLRSPLYGFTANELAEIRDFDKRGDFYNALLGYSKNSEKCRSFLSELQGFRDRAADLPTDRLLRYIYDRTGLPEIAAALSPGASGRLYMLLEHAREFEKNGYKGLFYFVNQLNAMAELDDPPLKTQSAGTGDDVLVTSIHNSKGLEYPVVILADLVKQFNRDDTRKALLVHQELGSGPKRVDLERRIEYPTLPRLAIAAKMNDEMLSEEMRVLYVAMTRAKEKLVMLVSLKGADVSLEKLRRDASYPVAPQVLENSKSTAEWLLYTVLAKGGAAIVRAEPSEERQTEKPAETGELEIPDELIRQMQKRVSFKYANTESAGLPSKLTATELKGGYRAREAEEEAEVYISRPDGFIFKRPGFVQERGLTNAEKGTALHMAMQYIDYSRCLDLTQIRSEVERLCELRLITPEQAGAVDAERILRFFSSDLGKRVLSAQAVYREFKFSLLISAKELLKTGSDDKILFQGVVDLCIEEDGFLTVIDFKTDFVKPSTRRARALYYKNQLDAYALALNRIQKKPVKEKIIYFFSDSGVEYLD